MENHQGLGMNLDRVITKDDSMNSVNSVTTGSEDDSSLRPYMTHRERIRNVLHSHKFQVAIIVMVILDCLLVIVELLLDVKILEIENEKNTHENHSTMSIAPHVLHYCSIGILSLFIIEIMVKVYAFGFEFFRHKLEVFDALVVFISFALDVAFRDEETVTNGFGLVIILRLWRVARILNGVVLSVKTQADHKLLKERRRREGIEQELQKCRDYANALEREVDMLRNLLKRHGIKEIPPTVVEPNGNQPCTTISVEAEVNHEQPT